MLPTLIYSSVAFVGGVCLFQLLYVIQYHRVMAREGATLPPGSEANPETKRVALILPLRGCDPSLEKCLESIGKLDHSAFTLHLVFDSKQDSAIQQADRFLNATRLSHQVHFLPNIADTGSLKCQALVYVAEQVIDSVEVVAIVDADAIVPPDWLGKLVRPLDSDQVGATTGNRWFTPKDGNVGSQLRRIWNAAAIVQMQLYSIPWGGSLAIKTDSVREAGLLSKWKTAFCEDTMISRELATIGQRVERLADLIVDNDERTSMNGCFRWITRQLLTVRLHHPFWILVLLHGLSVGIAFCLPVFTALLSFLLYGDWSAMMLSLVTLVFYFGCNAALIHWITSLNHSKLSTESHQAFNPGRSYWIAMALAPIIQIAAALAAATIRIVTWRGVTYELDKGEIRVQNYVPFESLDETDQSMV